MIFKKKTLFSLLLSLYSATGAFGDAVFLKDGKVRFGKVQKESDRDLTLQTQSGKETLVIHRSDVLRILYKDEIPRKYIYLMSGDKKRAFIVDENARSITIRNDLEVLREEKIARKTILSISETELRTTSLPYLFRTHARAKNVAIEGDFTGWQSIALEREGTDGWQVSLPIDILKKNEYEYRFVIDGNPQSSAYIRLTAEDGKLVEIIDHFDWRLQIAAGGHVYAAGYADSLDVLQPTAAIGLAFRLPLLSRIPKEFHLRLDSIFFRDRPNTAALPFFSSLSVETLNFGLFGSVAWRKIFWGTPEFSVGLGGGVVLQDTHTQGFRSAHVTNTIPAAQLRCSIAYPLTRRLALVLPVIVVGQFESRTTFVGAVMLGLEFAL